MASNNVQEEGEITMSKQGATIMASHLSGEFSLLAAFLAANFGLSATLPIEGLQEFNLDYGLSIT